MKTDNVSFKGYRNILQTQQAVEGHPELLRYGLVTQLTGKDLADWKEILKKFPDKTNSYCHNFVKIDCVWDFGSKKPGDAFLYLNDKKLEFNSQNAPVFIQIKAFFNEISTAFESFRKNKTPSPFPYDRNYIEALKRLIGNNREDVTINEIKKQYPIRSYENVTKIEQSALAITRTIAENFGNI